MDESKEKINPLLYTLDSNGNFDGSLLKKVTNEIVENILSQREKILEAFIAETGLLPSECEQVNQGNKWWIQKRNTIEPSTEETSWRAWRIQEMSDVHVVNKKHNINQDKYLTTECGMTIDMDWYHNPYSTCLVTCSKCIKKLNKERV